MTFKGGVVYRGSIKIGATGSENLPITFKGNAWGSERSIIDGTDVLHLTWTRCTSANQCLANPNYANLWHTDAPDGFGVFESLYEDGEFVWFSQEPDPEHRIFYKRHEDFRSIAVGDTNALITRTSIKAPDVFTQTDPAFYDGTYALVWHLPNVVSTVPITSYDPQNHTITVDDIGGDLYTDRDNRFAIVGNVGLIDQPGEFGLYGNQIVMWPHGSDDPNDHEYSRTTRATGVDFSNKQHIVLEGFDIRGFSYAGANSEGSSASDLAIRDNVIGRQRGYAALRVWSGTRVSIANNYVRWCPEGIGILAGGSHIHVDGNQVEFVSRQGIWLMAASESRATRNVVREIRATHANGLSVYQGSDKVLVAGNSVTVGKGNYPVTVSSSSNLWLIGNLIDGMGESNAFGTWGEMTGTNFYLQNTVVRGQHCALFVANDTWVVRNNILDGGNNTVATHTHNLYVGRLAGQNPPWQPGEGEILSAEFPYYADYDDFYTEQTLSDVFTGYAVGPSVADFHLRPGSVAVGSGVNISTLYPTDLFPDYDFSLDLDGRARPEGTWSLGAYWPILDDSFPPTQPENLMAQALSATSVDLTWKAATDTAGGASAPVLGYKVFRDGVEVATVAEPAYTDTDLTPATEFIYQVLAFDAAGNQSDLSLSASVETMQDLPTLSIGDATYDGTDAGSCEFVVTLSAPFLEDVVTVQYSTQDATAMAGEDYVGVSPPQTLVFPPGSVSQAIEVEILDQTVGEGDKAFSVILSGPVNAGLSQSCQAVGTIPGDAVDAESSSASPSQVTAGLVADFSFDEGTGLEAGDSTGNLNPALLANGARWVPGKSGHAVQMDGVGSCVVLPEDQTLLLAEKTVTFWARIDTPKTYNIVYGDTCQEYAGFSESGDLRITWASVAGQGGAVYVSKAAKAAGIWGFYAVVFDVDGANVAVSLYRDNEGIVYSTSSTVGIEEARICTIGARNNSGSLSFAGAIDDFRVYDRPLSAEEVGAVFEEKAAVPSDVEPPVRPRGLQVTPSSE